MYRILRGCGFPGRGATAYEGPQGLTLSIPVFFSVGIVGMEPSLQPFTKLCKA